MLGRCTPITIIGLILILSVSGFTQPNLSVPVEHFNFGFTPQNSMVSYKFWLHSNGTDTLKIMNVKTSCGCTKAPLEKSALLPGDSTALEVTFNSGQFVNRASKTITVTTNKANPNDQLIISADVEVRPDSSYPVVIKPYKVNMTQMGEKVRQSMKVSIVNVSDKDLTPSLVYYPQDIFDIELPKTIKAGTTGEMTLNIKSDKLSSNFNKSMTIGFNDEKNTRFTIPLTREIRTASK
jgi:hypothetical protein